MEDHGAETKTWFQDHKRPSPDAPLCFGYDPDTHEYYTDWYTTPEGHYGYDSLEDLDHLYRLVVQSWRLECPLVLLARQAPRYPLFFDIDLTGKPGVSIDEMDELTCRFPDGVLMRSIAASVLELYPQFNNGLEVCVFTSSGFSTREKAPKSSFHLVFPQIIVNRARKCFQEDLDSCENREDPRHLMILYHVVCNLTVGSSYEGSPLAELRETLLRASGAHVAAEENGQTFLSCDWNEMIDDRPVWHEPDPLSASGLRLPYTDKPREGRPLLPAARFRYSNPESEGDEDWPPRYQIDRLADLDPVEWVRQGDISRPLEQASQIWRPFYPK